MNILIVSQYAGSEKHGMVFRNYSLAKEWVKQGCKVTVLASSFSPTRISQPNTRGRMTEENIEGINYKWFWGPKLKNSSTINRIIMMFVFLIQVHFFHFEKNKFDVVIASSPHPFLIYPAFKFSQKMGAKLIFDIRDLWPLTLIEVGKISPKHPFIALMQKAEDFACCVCDLVIAVPRNCKTYLVARGLEEKRFLHIGNGAWKVEQEEPLPGEIKKHMLNLKQQGNRILGYTGALGIVNAMDIVIDSMMNTPDNLHLCIVGEGPLKQELEHQAIAQKLIHRIHFYGHLDKNMICSFLQSCDIVYAGTQKKKLYELGVSLTKMNDYMLAKKPIVYSVGDRGNPVEASGNGISCEPENAQEIAAALCKLTNMSYEELKLLGDAGYNWCLDNQLVSDQAKLILKKCQSLSSRIVK